MRWNIPFNKTALGQEKKTCLERLHLPHSHERVKKNVTSFIEVHMSPNIGFQVIGTVVLRVIGTLVLRVIGTVVPSDQNSCFSE